MFIKSAAETLISVVLVLVSHDEMMIIAFTVMKC